MKNFLLSLILLVAASETNAQTFSTIDPGFEGLDESSLSLADYDNDNDLDIILTGRQTNDERTSLIYVNDAGEYTPLALGLVPVKTGATSWGDYDMDGDLDLLITGNDIDGPSARAYRNDDGVFVDIEAGLEGVEEGISDWGDYDNDGDLDLVITGDWVAKIYRNDDGSFTDLEIDFGYFNSSSAAWGDFDNDGDLDLLLTGDSGAGAVSIVYRNDEGNFVEIGAGLPGVMAGKSGWVDFDNDSDLDIYLTGFDDALEAKFFLFRNDGHGIFEQITAWMPGVAKSSVAWGDMDNDGDLDVAFCGKGSGCGLYVSGIYRNDGDFFADINTTVYPLTDGKMEWADYDNDGDLDLFSTGARLDETPQTLIYLNEAGTNSFQENTLPANPTQYSTEVSGNNVTFGWNAGSDDETPPEGLSYNLRLSTISNSCNVWSPMAEELSGYRRIVSQGNAGQNHSWTIEGLPEGEYYWSVQTIDQAFAGSVFAVEKNFQVTATSIGESEQLEDAFQYFASSKTIEVNAAEHPEFKLRIFDIQGKEMADFQNEPSVSLQDFKAGIYIVHFSSNGHVYAGKISLAN